MEGEPRKAQARAARPGFLVAVKFRSHAVNAARAVALRLKPVECSPFRLLTVGIVSISVAFFFGTSRRVH